VSRRFVVVSGPPASGKSSVAPALAVELKLPLIAKDTIKDALMSVLRFPISRPRAGSGEHPFKQCGSTRLIGESGFGVGAVWGQGVPEGWVASAAHSRPARASEIPFRVAA
jgi:hypothetical protein